MRRQAKADTTDGRAAGQVQAPGKWGWMEQHVSCSESSKVCVVPSTKRSSIQIMPIDNNGIYPDQRIAITMPITTSSRSLVDQAMEEIRTYTVADVLPRLGDSNTQLVDIRDVRELADGTVVGAFHAPRGMLEFWVDPDSPYYKPIFGDEGTEYILFCGAGWRSALTAKTLQDMGMTNVAHIAGGYAEWVKQGGPTESLEVQKVRRASKN